MLEEEFLGFEQHPNSRTPLIREIPLGKITDTQRAVRFVVEQAALDEVDLYLPEVRDRRNQRNWLKELEIMRRYLINQESYASISLDHQGISRERIRFLAYQGFYTLWQRSLPDVREAVDVSCLQNLRGRKSLPFSMAKSNVQGGKLTQVMDVLSQGGDYEDLIGQGLSKADLTQVRGRLKLSGVDVPYPNLKLARNPQDLMDFLEIVESDVDKKRYLAEVDLSFLNYCRTNNLNVLTFFQQILKNLGLSLHAKKQKAVAEYLADPKIDIPFVEVAISGRKTPQVSRLICTTDLVRAEQAIRNNQELVEYLRNPLRYIFNPTQLELPTTNNLIPGKFVRLGTIARVFSDIDPEEFVALVGPGCPVPIIGFHRRRKEILLLDVSDRSEMADFLKSRGIE